VWTRLNLGTARVDAGSVMGTVLQLAPRLVEAREHRDHRRDRAVFALTPIVRHVLGPAAGPDAQAAALAELVVAVDAYDGHADGLARYVLRRVRALTSSR